MVYTRQDHTPTRDKMLDKILHRRKFEAGVNTFTGPKRINQSTWLGELDVQKYMLTLYQIHGPAEEVAQISNSPAVPQNVAVSRDNGTSESGPDQTQSVLDDHHSEADLRREDRHTQDDEAITTDRRKSTRSPTGFARAKTRWIINQSCLKEILKQLYGQKPGLKKSEELCSIRRALIPILPANDSRS